MSSRLRLSSGWARPAFERVSYQARGQVGREMINVLFDGSYKDGGGGCKKGGAYSGCTAPQMMEEALIRGFAKELPKGVDGNDEQKRGEWVTLPQSLPSLIGS